MNFSTSLITTEDTFVAAVSDVLRQAKTECPERVSDLRGIASDMVELGRESEKSDGWADWADYWADFVQEAKWQTAKGDDESEGY